MTPDEINEARVLHLAAHAIIPLIEERKQIAYERLMGDFRNSRTANLALVAECSAYTSILEDIHNKLQSYENLSKEKR
jgi:hypothetical protein